MCAPAGPKGALGRHANLFSRVAKSLQPDKEWVESYVRTTDINYQIGADNSAAVMRQFAIITKNGHDIAKIINDTFAYQTRVHEHTFAEIDRTVRGEELYTRPDGSPVEVPIGTGRVWEDNLHPGQFIRWPNNPDSQRYHEVTCGIDTV